MPLCGVIISEIPSVRLRMAIVFNTHCRCCLFSPLYGKLLCNDLTPGNPFPDIPAKLLISPDNPANSCKPPAILLNLLIFLWWQEVTIF